MNRTLLLLVLMGTIEARGVGAQVPRAQLSASLTLSSKQVYGGAGAVHATLHLSTAAPPNGVNVLLTSSDSFVARVPPSVRVAGQAKSATFVVQSLPVSGPGETEVEIAARVSDGDVTGRPVTARLIVLPPALVTVYLSRRDYRPGDRLPIGTVQLSSPAGGAGVEVALASSDTAVRVPAKLTIPSGQVAGQFAIIFSRFSGRKFVVFTARRGAVTRTTSLFFIP